MADCDCGWCMVCQDAGRIGWQGESSDRPCPQCGQLMAKYSDVCSRSCLLGSMGQTIRDLEETLAEARSLLWVVRRDDAWGEWCSTFRDRVSAILDINRE